MPASSIDRLLQRLGSTSDPGALVDELLDAIFMSQPREPAAAGLASRLVASPAALQQLVQLLHQQHAGTVELLAWTMIQLKGGDMELYRRLAVGFAAAPRPVVEALVGVLGCSTADTDTKGCAGWLLIELVNHSQSCARQAAAAGVFVHVAALLKQRPAGREEAAGPLLLPTRLCRVLISGSANRAQLAMQQGVLEALPALLGEGYPPDVEKECWRPLPSCPAASWWHPSSAAWCSCWRAGLPASRSQLGPLAL
jgi:hypothetical protein